MLNFCWNQYFTVQGWCPETHGEAELSSGRVTWPGWAPHTSQQPWQPWPATAQTYSRHTAKIKQTIFIESSTMMIFLHVLWTSKKSFISVIPQYFLLLQWSRCCWVEVLKAGVSPASSSVSRVSSLLTQSGLQGTKQFPSTYLHLQFNG